jgi:hypothetical protein
MEEYKGASVVPDEHRDDISAIRRALRAAPQPPPEKFKVDPVAERLGTRAAMGKIDPVKLVALSQKAQKQPTPAEILAESGDSKMTVLGIIKALRKANQ